MTKRKTKRKTNRKPAKSLTTPKPGWVITCDGKRYAVASVDTISGYDQDSFGYPVVTYQKVIIRAIRKVAKSERI